MSQSPYPAERPTAAAVVTAYHPDERLAAVVESALLSCEAVVVADNTPGDAPSLADKLAGPRVTVLRSGHNRGLAGALNAGLAALPAEAEAVLLLDQDSVLPPELVSGLVAHLAEDPRIGVVGPTPVDAETGGRYERSADRHAALDDRPGIITSGMVVRRSCFASVPGFREDFFVDYVDLDFCLRLKRSGVRIVRDLALELPHSIGDVRVHRVPGREIQVGHYAAWRHYWIARNGTILIRENLRPMPVWAVTNLLFMSRWFVQLALFEPKRRTHVPAFLRGLRDGLTRGVTRKFIPAGAQYHGRD